MFGEDFIEIVDEESGDTYFYEVPIEVNDMPSVVDVRLMIEEMINEALHGR